MELKLFLVMTLLSVHVFAQLQKETPTVAEFETTTTVPHSTKLDLKEEQSSTIQTTSYFENDQTSPSISLKYGSPVSAIEPSTVHNTTEEMTTENVDSKTTQVQETSSKSTNLADLVTTNTLLTKDDLSTSTASIAKTIYQNVNHTTTMNSGSKIDAGNSTGSILEKTTTVPSPENFFRWLDSIHPENVTEGNVTEAERRNDKSKQNEETVDLNSRKESIDPNMMPPREFMKWLDSIHPHSNATKTSTVTIKNVIDTSIISTEKLIIVISTICGTFVLFVAILIAISCCRKKRNMRNDSEKSDFSMTSVVSIPEKRKSDVYSTDKNGFNNLFMGIPANNEVWKNLEQLSPAAPSVMPESTKM